MGPRAKVGRAQLSDLYGMVAFLSPSDTIRSPPDSEKIFRVKETQSRLCPSDSKNDRGTSFLGPFSAKKDENDILNA